MKRKVRRYRIRFSILLFILFISIVGSLAYFSSYPRLVFNKINVNGTRIINPSDIESSLQEGMKGKYVYLFTRNNSLIYPKKTIYNNLLAKFPRIETLAIYRDNLNTLHVDITERAGAYLYCGELVPEMASDIGENCYFVNNDGYVFDKAPYFSGNLYFKYYMPLPDGSANNPLSKQILPPSSFHALARFVDSITDLGFKPNYVVLDKDGNATLYLNHAPNATNTQIIFKNNENIDTMLANLSASMKKSEFANEINSKYSSLLYIDLRFNNKVIYKFQ